ncbi:hypothetical protein BDV97DRAFT_362488 [Delphinella strobiligena]|nr:hypothetical protein BDV97DRAFT_362488 [Delphinella strobiligena]
MWSPLKCTLTAPCDASGRSVYGILVPVCCLQTTHGIVCSEPDNYVPAPAFPSHNSTQAAQGTSSSTRLSRLNYSQSSTYHAKPTSNSILTSNATYLLPSPTLSNLTTNVTTHAGPYPVPSNPGAAAVTIALTTSRPSDLAAPTTTSSSVSTWAVHVLTDVYSIPKSSGPFTLTLPIGLDYYAGTTPATRSTITASAVLTAGSHSTPASLLLVCPASTSTLAASAAATSVRIGLICLVSYEGRDIDMGAANAIAVPVAFGLPISAPTSVPVSKAAKVAKVTKVLGGSAVDVGPPVMVVPGTETIELSQAVSTGPTVTVGPPVMAVPTVAVPVAPSNVMSKAPACSSDADGVLSCIR